MPTPGRQPAAASKRLSPHFLASEFAQHDGRDRTPAEQLYWLTRLCTVYLEPLRAKFGPVTIVSGFRSPSYNAGVGGAPASFHTRRPDRRGAAADVKCARGRSSDWYRFLDSLDPGGLGIYPTWVHVDNRAGRARW